jgi:putative two-component system hydrogenase maturation factor HypX/HoxX
MKILFFTTAFNSLAQRAWLEFDRLNHQIKVHIVNEVLSMEKAVLEFKPDLIIAPFLKSKIPASIWKRHLCLVVHPGPVGDRGASSLDWAILKEEKEWGVTILQAGEKMDAGLVWASRKFPIRKVSKSNIYRHEITDMAIKGLFEAVDIIEKPANQRPESFKPYLARGKWRRTTTQKDFSFSWDEYADDILRKICAADGSPGVLVDFFGQDYFAYGGHLEKVLKGIPGQILAKRDELSVPMSSISSSPKSIIRSSICSGDTTSEGRTSWISS